MKLSECTIGTMVITEDLEIGHIVGITYNCSIALTGSMNNEERYTRTIPVVKFPAGERSVHHVNLKKFSK